MQVGASFAEARVSQHKPYPFRLLPTYHETRAENLQDLPDFKGLNIPRSKGGEIDPVTDLFRTDWPGVTTGPVVSQFLLSDFLIDSIVVTPKADPLLPGMDYMTAFQPWLDVQVGITPQL